MIFYNQISLQYKLEIVIYFLKLLEESNNFLLNTIFGKISDVGVNYATSVLASAEACREVGGRLSWTDIDRIFQKFKNRLKSSRRAFSFDSPT